MMATEGTAAPENNKKIASNDISNGTKYFDNDFDWQDAAQARHGICCGDMAPEIQHAEELLTEGALAKGWDEFYEKHENKFFKGRSYLFHAFFVLDQVAKNADSEFCISELGCGTGSTIFPLLKQLPNLKAVVVDVAPSAIKVLQAQLNEEKGRFSELKHRCSATVCDIVTQPLVTPEQSMDFVVMVFTLSAITPKNHFAVLEKAVASLKPGGYLLFRDYGLYDMVQTRCVKRVGENEYIKQDGVHVYFFSTEYLLEIADKLGLESVQVKYCTVRNVNRKQGRNIDRVFLNGIWRKRSEKS